MLALASAMPAFAPSSMPMVQPTTGSISAKMESVEDLKARLQRQGSKFVVNANADHEASWP